MKHLRFGNLKKRNSQYKVVPVKTVGSHFSMSGIMESYNNFNATDTLKSIYGLDQ